MKKALLFVSVLMFAGVALTSCNKNTPKSVASAWLTDFYHMDYDAATALSTEDTKPQLAQLAQLASYVNDSSKKEMKKIVVTVKDVKQTGDTAVATYVLSDNAGKDQYIKLFRQKGKWLVEFSKEDNMNAADQDAGQASPADTTNQETSPADTSSTDTVTNPD